MEGPSLENGLSQVLEHDHGARLFHMGDGDMDIDMDIDLGPVDESELLHYVCKLKLPYSTAS